MAPGWLVVTAVLALLAGCAQSAKKSSVTRAPDTEPYRLESEGQAAPPGPGEIRREIDHVDVFEETPVSEETLAVENVVEEVPPEPALDDSMVTGPGFRVQVFATGVPETAEIHRQEAETHLGMSAYVQLIDGMYKVRIGDCRTRNEAESLLQRCREAGYTDAWIVTSEVRWRRPTVTPPPQGEQQNK